MENLFVLNPDYETPLKYGKRIHLKRPIPETSLGCSIWVILYIFVEIMLPFLIVATEIEIELRFMNSASIGAVVQRCMRYYAGRSITIELDYLYGVPGQTIQYTGNERISGTSVKCPEIPETIWIQYLPDEPSQSRIIDPRVIGTLLDRTFKFTLISFCVALFVLPSIYILVGSGFWKRTKQATGHQRLAYLENYGMPITGEIVHCEGQIQKEHYELSVVYRFASPSGKLVEDHARAVRDDLQNKPLPAVGTSVIVLYADNTSYLML